MIFHENRLLADDSHEISFLISFEIWKDVEKFVVCCSRDWRFKGLSVHLSIYLSVYLLNSILLMNKNK